MSFSNPYTYFAKYPFVFDDLYLIAEVDKNSGRQFLVMQKIDKRTSRVLFEDRIQCIHTAITIIPVEDFEDSVSDEEFEKDMIYIRSSEGASEFTLDIDEKFFAFRSWVAGIAESGIDAITIQSEIEQYSSLMYPIANRLFNFLLKSKVEFLQKFMEKTEKDCVLDGKPHQASLNANLLKVLDIIVLKEKEAWNAWRERVEENYNWSDDFNLYLIEQFEEFLVNIIELQPSANIFLEKDKFNFILTTEEAKFLSDFNKVTQDSVHYEHKFHFCYIDGKNRIKSS